MSRCLHVWIIDLNGLRIREGLVVQLEKLLIKRYEIMSLIDEVKELQKQLNQKEEEYLQSVSPCKNTSCSWNRNYGKGCSWSVLLEDCKYYKPE